MSGLVDRRRVPKIDRSKPVDLIAFIGNGYSIDEQDERSVSLTEVDMSKVILDSTLCSFEMSIKGERNFERLKEKNYIRLDIAILKTLFENPYLIPETWKEKAGGNVTYIFFDGTVLRDPGYHTCVMSLCWREKKWNLECHLLEEAWFQSYLSAVIEP